MKSNYTLMNCILGWVVFTISAITYLLTVEPTTALWDCGEFITSAHGLEVGHPPGAPFFMIIARFFALFAPHPSEVALMVNIMSAMASAFTVMFLFWTITHLAKKAIVKEELSKGNVLAIMGAGLVGSLAYTFSDTFWFSAVEGEVYALSSLFTALVFWAILKWENVAHEKHANRWLILIAYLMGLSIGVHLLNLLAIPAIVFVYYFKKYHPSRNGVIAASVVSVAILAGIMYGIIPGVVKAASWFELLFVNSFSLPYNTGVIVYTILLIAFVVWAIRFTIKKNYVVLNTIVTAFMVIVIGYSSFAMIVIRSSANPPMDENNPDNVFALLSYLNREQYGDRPLLHGAYYNAPILDFSETKANYIQKNNKYVIASRKQKMKYHSSFETLFPRMFSSRKDHIQEYENWGKVKKDKPIALGNGEVRYKPGFAANLRFFFRYQVVHMYWRYFMWNFAGRQNDIQGHGGILHGNWISGIPFVDKMKVGNQEKLYPELKNKKSRNTYFFLPFILGLIGLIYQFKSDKKDFSVVMLLFFFTGLAIVIYLNQHPLQPRERDYAYAGSFYAFAIWIGFGVMGLYQNMKRRKMKPVFAAVLVTGVCLLAVPALMAQQNWDDHDRSGRYASLAHAKNYLESCAPNAILFTYGDNDTFPLWYAQEVEGIRRDIRIVNLSLLAGDWYINQMRTKAYDSDPLKISLTADKIEPGKRDQIAVRELIKTEESMLDMLKFVASDKSSTMLEMQGDIKIHYFPGRNVYIPVDSAKVLKNGTVCPEDAHLIKKKLNWKIPKDYLYKNDLVVYDIIANNNWERPIYFSIGMGVSSFLGLEKYFQLEGAAYRLVPIETKSNAYEIGRINNKLLYNNLVHKFEFGRIKEPDVYVDEFHIRTIKIMCYRETYCRLANSLNNEGKAEQAIEILNKCMTELPNNQVPYDHSLIGFVQEYYRAGEIEKANALFWELFRQSHDRLSYYFSLEPALANAFHKEQEREVRIIQMLLELANTGEQHELRMQAQQQFELLIAPLGV